MNRIVNRLGAAAVFALSVGLVAGASAKAADSNVIAVSIAVSYGDLDLSKPAGVQRLRSRVKAAATEACGGLPDTRDLVAIERFDACARTAIDGALARVAAAAGRPLEQVASAK